MAFEIAINSDFPQVFYAPAEFADLTGDSPVVDFSRPRARFRVTVLLKAGAGGQVFSVQLADNPHFTENVRSLGEHALDLATKPSVVVHGLALRGPQRYGRITVSGSGDVYDARLEWSGS